ncbi:MAG TPA: vWA domain-containing protein [Sedimentisphaerales bacterium]|nr:vWA domain-containing protein [Sedimentisphaerales bacterium]HRS10293.1 vWA domain-containing protein [Sedimentisphaerales bacterium]HRV46998.1 vWA domain-containing protein [Sedimentisphaerales bacterium]
MNRGVSSVLLVSLFVGMLAAPAAVPADASEGILAAAPPCYVVIAVDVSGGMERADTPADDGRGRRSTLRADAQLVTLQLLPYLYSDLYIGVCHFSDRVRYSLPSEETAPLLAWGGSYLNEAACRNMVRDPEFTGSFYAELDQGLDWALARIQAARRQHGNGPGKIILLSRGDPRDAARDIRTSGPLFDAAARLTRQNVRVYPVLVNRASYRTGGSDASSSDRTAEEMMTALAALTDGKAYRITRTMGLPDILMDVFGLGTALAEKVSISRYDWATVIVGRTPASLSITPAAGASDNQTRVWALDAGFEADAGIRTSRVTSGQWQAMILHRPGALDRVWEGHWKLSPPEGARLYRIPDFLVQLEPRPASPWWVHQQGQVAAQVLDRHKDTSTRTSDASDALSIRLTATSGGQSEPPSLDGGQWTIPSRRYESNPFTIGTFGLYEFRAELVHRAGDADISLTDATSEVLVHPPCVRLSVLDVSGAILGSLSDASEPVSVNLHGGQSVVLRLSPEGTFGVKPLSGRLRVEPLTQTDWTFRKDEQGNLVAGPIALPEGELRISGWAEAQVETPAGPASFRLPRFALAYGPAPVQIRCAFTDPRQALWVGELHRQLLTIAAFPVFDADRERVVKMFPETLHGARLRTVDLTSGTAQVMTPRVRLVGVPKPTGLNGRTLAATYALESDIPLPRADQCEISLDGTIEGLGGAVKTYAVVDPIATGMLQWVLYQPPGEAPAQGLAETVYCGEPVRFTAQWQASENISSVRLELVRPGAAGPMSLTASPAVGEHQALLEQTWPDPLQSGQTYPAFLYVVTTPPAAGSPVEIKLDAGRVHARDRRLLLEELTVGEQAGSDVACHPWEPVRIPLRVVFGGYIAGNTQHSAWIDRVKTSCRVTVTSPFGDVQDVSDSIEWTALTPSDTREGRATRCELKGYAPYVPRNSGRAAVEMSIEFARERAAPATQHAYGHLAIKEPRLALSVQRLTSSGRGSLFDSQTWATGSGGLAAVTTQLSTRLQMTVRPLNWTTALPLISLTVLRRSTPEAPWTTVSSSTGDLVDGSLTREAQVADNGQYAVEMIGRDPQSGQIVASLTTPVVLSIQPHEVVPVLSPAAWITPGVRQWPFEYRVSVRSENGGAPQVSAMAFEFQLPSAHPIWLEGSVHATGSSSAEGATLSLKSPDLLPPLEGPASGSVQFRLSSQGQEMVRWECPNVRVLPPVLGRLDFRGGRSGTVIEPAAGRLDFDGSAALWVRPVFRAAPELTGQWVRGPTTIYLWPARDRDAPAGQPTSQLIQELKTQGASIQVFRVDGGEAEPAVRILPQLAHRGFWGWPKPAATHRYAVVGCATYEMPGSPDPMPISEWTDVTFVSIATAKVVPWCWWALAAVAILLLVVFVLKLLVPRPGRLGLDVRLAENIATVEPASFHSPVAIDLRGTPLRTDVDLHVAHALSGLETGGLKPLVAVLVAAGVLLRRGVYPRRWAWALITPRIGPGVRHVRKGLLCVWTGPLARRGRLWSRQTGTIPIPGPGQAASISLDLPYRMDGTARSIRVSVRIRNGEPPAAPETADSQTST